MLYHRGIFRGYSVQYDSRVKRGRERDRLERLDLAKGITVCIITSRDNSSVLYRNGGQIREATADELVAFNSFSLPVSY